MEYRSGGTGTKTEWFLKTIYIGHESKWRRNRWHTTRYIPIHVQWITVTSKVRHLSGSCLSSSWLMLATSLRASNAWWQKKLLRCPTHTSCVWYYCILLVDSTKLYGEWYPAGGSLKLKLNPLCQLSIWPEQDHLASIPIRFASPSQGIHVHAGEISANLCRGRSLTPVSNACKAVSISLFWNSPLRFNFPFNLICKLIMAFLTC